MGLNSVRYLALATTLLLFAEPAALLAGSSPSLDSPRITDIKIGLDGACKVGYWTPVHITIDAGAKGFTGRIKLTAADNDELIAQFVQAAGQPLVLKPNEQWTGWRYFKIGRLRSSIRIALYGADEEIVAQRIVRVVSMQPSSWQWIVTVGTDMGVKEAAVFLVRERDAQVLPSLLRNTNEFPDQWFGYEGVDVLLVPAGSESLLETLSDQQFAALVRWLQLGGRLVLAVANRAGKLFAPDHRFHVFRPGTFLELDEHWKASGLENFARASERFYPDKRSPLAVFSELRGRTLCLEGAGGSSDRALVTQFPVGFGEVTYVALDLDLPPLSQWSARPRLLARLLQPRSDMEDSAIQDDRVGQVTHVGFEDLVGQLRAALDQFPGVTLVHFSWVAGLLVVYILIIGPLDYFGLRRIGRPHWTWITFPATVLFFCGLAVWLAMHWKGTRAQMNQVDIVDIDLVAQTARGTTWTDFYSPETTVLDITATPEPRWPVPTKPSNLRDRPETILSWQGLPGTGMGGMSTIASTDALNDEFRLNEAYHVNYPSPSGDTGQNPQIERLPVHTAASKSLIARWTMAVTLTDTPPLTANQTDLLEGTVTNPLDVELSHCQVCYENWTYVLERPLAPGASIRLDTLQPLDLRWRLTRRSVIGVEEVRSAWERDNLSDVDRILEMLMFYGAASGRAYTGLAHDYQSYIDLSHHLQSGRAILVGRCKSPATRLTIHRSATGDNQEVVAADAQRHWTYYRIIIPVAQANSVQAKAPSNRPTP